MQVVLSDSEVVAKIKHIPSNKGVDVANRGGWE